MIPIVVDIDPLQPGRQAASCAFDAGVEWVRTKDNGYEIDLPDATARAAREAGLLTPQALERLLTEAIRRQQGAESLLAIAGRVADAGVEPMAMDEIDAEVKAVRAECRRRASSP